MVAVVPALNEAHSIVGVVKRTAEYVDEVVVIDDGSSDETRTLAGDAGAVAHAQERRATAVVQVDGDGQHEADGIPALLALLDAGADLVVGTRFEHGFDMGRVRRLVLRVFAWLMSYRLGTRITDPTSGFRAFSPRAVDVLTPIFPLKYLSDTVEVLYLAADHGLRIVTVPVSMNARTGGKPSASTVQSIGYALRMMGIVAKHTFAYRQRRR